jgi:hypothetical protein
VGKGWEDIYDPCECVLKVITAEEIYKNLVDGMIILGIPVGIFPYYCPVDS